MTGEEGAKASVEARKVAAPSQVALIVCVGGLVLCSVRVLARLLRGSKVRPARLPVAAAALILAARAASPRRRPVRVLVARMR